MNQSPVAKSLEDFGESCSDHVDDLVVVKLEGHLHVEADELRQVTMGVGVLGTKYTTDGENLAKTAGKNKLLLE
jgi:hypothetical protein